MLFFGDLFLSSMLKKGSWGEEFPLFQRILRKFYLFIFDYLQLGCLFTLFLNITSQNWVWPSVLGSLVPHVISEFLLPYSHLVFTQLSGAGPQSQIFRAPSTCNTAELDYTLYSWLLLCKWCPWGCAVLQPCSGQALSEEFLLEEPQGKG